jgi:hypothetical protein
MKRSAVAALVALVVVPVFPGMGGTASAQSCSRVSGGSQTSNWYTNGRFESLVVAAQWERQSRGGQSIDDWGLGNSGWSTRVWSPCSPVTSPTRWVLNVLPDSGSTLDQIVGWINEAREAAAVNLPAVTRITLIPPVGGNCPGVGLASRQGISIDAIDQVVGGVTDGSVDAGPVVSVPDCAMFRDNAGHLTSAGAEYAASQFAAGL